VACWGREGSRRRTFCRRRRRRSSPRASRRDGGEVRCRRPVRQRQGSRGGAAGAAFRITQRTARGTHRIGPCGAAVDKPQPHPTRISHDSVRLRRPPPWVPRREEDSRLLLGVGVFGGSKSPPSASRMQFLPSSGLVAMNEFMSCWSMNRHLTGSSDSRALRAVGRDLAKS